jgi:hypothetical protein
MIALEDKSLKLVSVGERGVYDSPGLCKMITLEDESLNLISGGAPCNCACSGGMWQGTEYRGVYDSPGLCDMSCRSGGWARGTCV